MVKRCLLLLTGAGSLLLLTSAATAEPAVPDSTAAMLRLHMTLGGRSTGVSQTSLTMSFGYHWRQSRGLVGALEHHFMPALQAGWTPSGRPVIRVGAIDALRVFSGRANAEADEASGGNARFVWIALGVITVGATVAALATPDDDSEYECNPVAPPPPLPPPPGTPSPPCRLP